MAIENAGKLAMGLTDEQLNLQKTIREFASNEIDQDYIRRVEKEKRFPTKLWDKMSDIGLPGIAVPEEYGGMGGGIMEQVIVEEELARVMGAQATLHSITTHSAITIADHGTPEQKDELLPKIADGDVRVGLSITEPGGGTDVLGALETSAEKVDGGWVINGSKVYTTMAEDVDYLLLLARTGTDGGKADGLTVFLLPTDNEGIEMNRMGTMGLEATGTFEVHYDDVYVDDYYVLGEPHEGWHCLTDTITHERIIIAALCTGSTAGVIEEASGYAKEREAFGDPIGKYQAVQHHIANMQIRYEASRLMTYRAARLADDGEPHRIEANVAKAFASETVTQAADKGIQVLGGAGFTTDFEMERFWRETRIMQIGPISNEMIRNEIAESMGMPRSY